MMLLPPIEFTMSWNLCKIRRIIPFVIILKHFYVICGYGFNIVFSREKRMK